MASGETRLDLLRAVAHLVRGRLSLPHLSASELIAMRREPSTNSDPRTVSRISYAIPRVAPWLPWRSDCLVQAIAARRWLAGLGIASTLHMGVRKDEQSLGAHAWLSVGDTVVTGLPIDAYVPLPIEGRDGESAGR